MAEAAGFFKLFSALAFSGWAGATLVMSLPTQPITLNPEQIADLNRKLSNLRHNVNNHLSLVVAAAELMRRKPEEAIRFIGCLSDRPEKINQEVSIFSRELEKALQITRD
jgi:hypothetical protein